MIKAQKTAYKNLKKINDFMKRSYSSASDKRWDALTTCRNVARKEVQRANTLAAMDVCPVTCKRIDGLACITTLRELGIEDKISTVGFYNEGSLSTQTFYTTVVNGLSLRSHSKSRIANYILNSQ